MRINLSSLRKNLNFQILILASLMPGLLMFPVSVQANPAGANVVYGNVNIQGLGTANVNIISGSQNSIINWQSFSIQSGESTHFQQPGASSVSLNRVVTGDPSAIYGSLTSNGGLILINPNGIVVGSGGVVDVAGMMTLSTLDTTNEDFLNGGSMHFRGTNGKGIVVQKYGAVTSSGGDVTLLGNFLQNSGSVSSPTGTVAFGAGGDIIVNQTASGGKISVLSGGTAGENSITNDGTISGAAAELKAHGNVYALAIKNDGVIRANGYNFKGGRLTLSGGSRSNVINTGTLSARNADGSGGQISVSGREVSLAGGTVDASGAAGMNGGSVSVTANKIDVAEASTIDVGGATAGSVDLNGGLASTVNGSIQAVGNGGDGGSIDVSADVVSVGSTANINASGVDGGAGGNVRLGGGFQGGEFDIKNSQKTTVEEGALIFADSSGQDAGRVVVWSDGDTLFRGDVSAQALGNVGNGGFVEVSGLRGLNYFGKVSTASVNGATGRLLLDPTDVIIGNQAGATISDTALVAAVLANNVVIHTASSGPARGNILVQGGANVVYDSPNSLAFFAHGDIRINGDIKNHGTTDTPTVDYDGNFNGTGNITLVAGWDGTGAGAFNFDPDSPAGANDGPRVTAADVLAGTYGAWGTNDGSIFLNDAGSEPVEVGSARGETNAFAHRVEMRAGLGNERFTQLGYRRENDLRGVAEMEYAEFHGGLDGTTSPQLGAGTFRIRANNATTTTITLTGDGVKDIDTLVGEWNAANPGNEITVLYGGGEKPDAAASIVLDDTINTAADVNFFDGVTGNINVHANQDVLLVPSTAISTSEGIKTNDRAYIMIGHGGLRENDNGMESRGGTDYGSDSGHISVGNGFNTGNITVNAGRALVMTGNRAENFVQIGHGGMGGDDPDGNTGNAASHTFNPYTFFPGLGDVTELGLTDVGSKFVIHPNQVGAATSDSTEMSIWGNMSGNITITAGLVDMEAGMYNRAAAQIGHGGTRVRGSHSGDISVTTTTGGILVEAAPDSAIGGPANSNDWRWNQNRDQSYAQIGHGGFDTDYFDSFQLPRRNDVTLNTGEAAPGVDNTSIAGDGIRINPFSTTGAAYGHHGDVTVISATEIEARAGNGTDAYAMFGHGGRSTHGDHGGDIKVEAQNGGILFDRDADQLNERGRDITNRGQRAHVQIGHGGGRYQGGSTGEIDVDATGDIEFYAGRSESYAMIGHGGRGEDGSTWNAGRQRNNQANGTHSGNISVDTTGGDIIFRSGFSPRGTAFSQIGHGGYFQQADVVDTGQAGPNGANQANDDGKLVGGGAATEADQGHNGDISVTASGNISFKAGADTLREGQDYFETNAYDSWTMIGHGGRQSRGDHHGQITVEATTGDIEFEARGGWDAVGIRSTNSTGTPRLNSTDDNARNGFRNWAMIGHGGYDTEHYNGHGDNWNNSGLNGNGFGRSYDAAGALDVTDANISNIMVTSGGNTTFMGAMQATAGPVLPIAIYDDNTYDPPNNADASERPIVNNDGQATYVSHEPIYIGNADGSLATTVVIAVDRTTPDSGEVFFNDVGDSDMVILTGTGDTINDRIAAHNAAATQSGNLPLIELRGGDGTQTLAAGEQIVITPYSTYQGSPAGTTAPVLLRANALGTADIVVTGDGSMTLTELAAANGFTIVDGIGGNVLDNGETITLSGGLNARPDLSDTNQAQAFSRHYGRLDVVYRANGEVWNLPDPVYSAEDGWASIGHGGRSSEYRGGVDGEGFRGDITLNVGGDLSMLAGDINQAVSSGQELPIRVRNYQNEVTDNAPSASVGLGNLGGLGVYYVGPGIGSGDSNFFENRGEQNDGTAGIRNYVMIGNGGYGSRGDHAGNINLTVTGDIDVIAAEGRQGFAQIGHGGYDADGSNDINTRKEDDGNSGTITINSDGKLRLLAGNRGNDVVGEPGDDIAVQSTHTDVSRSSYAQIGHGGAYNGGSHSGNIEVHMGTGVEMLAGSGRFNYSMIGNGGVEGRSAELSGEIMVITDTGDITLNGPQPVVDSDSSQEVIYDPFDELGIGIDDDAIAGNNNVGHISPGRESATRIGHGGYYQAADRGDQNNAAGIGGSFGSITVVATTGNVVVHGGGDSTLTRNDDYYRSQEAQIGHGGWNNDGDMVGNISVAAGQNITVMGGGAAREAFGQIGHGGYAVDGNHSGTIDLDAGLSVILQRGDGEHNPWAKIGHGAQSFGGRNNNGTGTKGGDITVSAGLDFMSTFGLVGHVDSRNDGDIFDSEDGNTYIAVSRNDRFAGGTGRFVTDADTVITSGGFGSSGELRLYMPDSGQNEIAEATQLNTTEYSRSVPPGSGRNDEHVAPEHAFATGAFGEVEGLFTPEGVYPTNSFGLYNVYYAGTAPPEDLVDLGNVGFDFNFLPFLFEDEFDAFDRQQGFLYYDGYDGQLYSVSLADAVEDEGNPEAGGFFLEEMLDNNLGSRRDATATEENGTAEAETDEERRRRKDFASRKVGRTGVTFYVFSPGTNRYSSYRVFGVPEGGLGPVQ